MKRIQKNVRQGLAIAIAAVVAGTCSLSFASSHREAPMITGMPRLDGTDLYMFRSYESGRSDYITILANYFPLQEPGGGPNYFDLETAGLYEIHIDNDGDNLEDMTFSFDFSTVLAGAALPIGGKNVPIPLIIAGGVGPGAMDTANVNSRQEYTLNVVRGDRRTGTSSAVTNGMSGATKFRKPLDYIGTKSIPNYQAYSESHIYPITIPGCSAGGRVFVGQRQEGFAVNVGPIFDLVNLNPLGSPSALPNPLRTKNITTLALEIPSTCLVKSDPVIGAWTTSSLNVGNAPMQVSRLGFPLINELVIGLPDKDKFNGSEPYDDGWFANYVLNPTLPALLELLFADAGAKAPTAIPRVDLVQAIGGVPGLNQPARQANGTFGPSEMLRLNTSMPALAAAQQKNLGVLANDTSGFPNGRRPGDDVVDIILRVMMGALITDSSKAPNNTAPFTDQTTVTAMDFKQTFPYLNTPLPGAGGATGS